VVLSTFIHSQFARPFVFRERLRMDTLDDRFTVFLRDASDQAQSVEVMERPVATLATYEEARRVCHAYQSEGLDCVIRFAGPAGGGD
jgi:hypothetical protein